MYLPVTASSRMRVGLFAALLAVFATPLIAQEQNFTLVNNSGVEIHQLFIAADATDNWEEDVLGADTLPDGDSVTINFVPAEDAELWDIKVVDSEGNSLEWDKLNLTEISTVTLHYENGKGWAETE